MVFVWIWDTWTWIHIVPMDPLGTHGPIWCTWIHTLHMDPHGAHMDPYGPHGSRWCTWIRMVHMDLIIYGLH